MALKGAISVSVVEDVQKQHGPRMCDIDLASRKEEQAVPLFEISRFEVLLAALRQLLFVNQYIHIHKIFSKFRIEILFCQLKCWIDSVVHKMYLVIPAKALMRRYEAAAWLKRMVGVVGVRDLPEEPTEEEFRLALRNGIVLCNTLNKVKPGAVPKVIEAPVVSASLPDGAAALSFQYFEYACAHPFIRQKG